MPTLLPFTWTRFENETGREFPAPLRRRVLACVRNPTRETWLNARSLIVAPQASIMGQTLWQCVEAVTLSRYEDGRVPDQATLVRALCYAAGIPDPAAARR